MLDAKARKLNLKTNPMLKEGQYIFDEIFYEKGLNFSEKAINLR
jgi:hypothetical protein